MRRCQLSRRKKRWSVTAEAARAHADDLVEIPTNCSRKRRPLSKRLTRTLKGCTKVLGHMKSLEIEEILGLWGVIFPRDREVWYDEEKRKFNYQRDESAVHAD